MPLPAKDLQKKTEKELDKWRKDRPSSTFDPRSRCLGYQMAWATTLHNHEEQEKEKMERGNLSVPLSRSSSTLSLSFIPNNKRRKGTKGNAGEWESSGKVVRHVSMGAKDDHRNWSDVHFMKKRDVKEEDVILKQYVKQSNSHTVNIKQKEAKRTDDIKNITEQTGQKVKEELEEEETKLADKEIGQSKEPEEPVILEQTGKLNAETLPTKDQTLEESPQSGECTTQGQQGLDSNTPSQPTQQQTKDETSEDTECTTRDKQGLDSDTPADPTQGQSDDQSSEDSPQTTEVANQCQQGPDSPSQVLEEHNHNGNDEEKEVQDQSGVMGKQMAERAVEEAQTGMQECDNVDTSRQQETEVDVQPTRGEIGTEGPDGTTEESCSDTNRDLEVPSVNSPTGTAQQEITEHSLEAGTTEGQNCSTEAPVQHTCTEEEAKVENVTDAAEMTQQDDAEEETKVAQDTRDGVALDEDSETEAETLTDDTKQDQTEAEEQIQTDEEAAVAQQADMTCAGEGISLVKGSPEDRKSPEEPAPDELLTTMCTNEKILESAQGNPAEERDAFTSPESPDSSAGSHPDAQCKEPPPDEQHEPKNVQAQAPGRRNSKSSGDFCIRRSSTSRGSRMGRRLSEDLFTVPDKPTTQPQSTSCEPVRHDPSRPSPVAVGPTQDERASAQAQGANLSQSGEAAQKVGTQRESSGPQKRFGLFRRLKAEQPKRNKAKGRPKMQVPKILIQDYSDGVASLETEAEPDGEEKLSSRERRRRRREQERRLKEEERLRKKREKELEKVMQQEKKRLQARGRGLQGGSGEKPSSDKTQEAQTGSQKNIHVASYAESYF